MNTKQKLNALNDSLLSHLQARAQTGQARPEEVMMATLLPMAQAALAGADPDDLDAGVGAFFAAASYLAGDEQPAVLSVPGLGAFEVEITRDQLADLAAGNLPDGLHRIPDTGILNAIPGWRPSTPAALPVPDPDRRDLGDR